MNPQALAAKIIGGIRAAGFASFRLARIGYNLIDFWALSRAHSLDFDFQNGSAAYNQDGAGERLCVFAHFDRKKGIDPYVEYYLNALYKQMGVKTLIVSTSTRIENAPSILAKNWCIGLIIRPNIGLDFCSWKIGLKALANIKVDVPQLKLLFLANDSCFGPFFDISKFLKSIETSPDPIVAGITENLEIYRHLQSYFLIFNQACLRMSIFQTFWKNVRPLRSKQLIINKYEVGLSGIFKTAGAHLTCLVGNQKIGEVAKDFYTNRSADLLNKNPTIYFWDLLLENRLSPFIKKSLFTNQIESKLAPEIDRFEAELAKVSDYPAKIIAQYLSK
jgi:lipopolysaccharide biosynthesis protein